MVWSSYIYEILFKSLFSLLAFFLHNCHALLWLVLYGFYISALLWFLYKCFYTSIKHFLLYCLDFQSASDRVLADDNFATIVAVSFSYFVLMSRNFISLACLSSWSQKKSHGFNHLKNESYPSRLLQREELYTITQSSLSDAWYLRTLVKLFVFLWQLYLEYLKLLFLWVYLLTEYDLLFNSLLFVEVYM